MIVDYTYLPQDLENKCYGCKWAYTIDGFNIKCSSPSSKVKNKIRTVLDKACSFKERRI